MKPIIIFKEKDHNGAYSFTEDELKKLLEEAYEDGYRECRLNHIYMTQNPVPYTAPTYPAWDTPLQRPIVTCNNDPTTSVAQPNPNITARC